MKVYRNDLRKDLRVRARYDDSTVIGRIEYLAPKDFPLRTSNAGTRDMLIVDEETGKDHFKNISDIVEVLQG